MNIVVKDDGNAYIEAAEVEKSERILQMLSNLTGWEYDRDVWTWSDFQCIQFSKNILDSTTSFKKRNALLEQRPLSLAITATNRVEYTIDQTRFFD